MLPGVELYHKEALKINLHRGFQCKREELKVCLNCQVLIVKLWMIVGNSERQYLKIIKSYIILALKFVCESCEWRIFRILFVWVKFVSDFTKSS